MLKIMLCLLPPVYLHSSYIPILTENIHRILPYEVSTHRSSHRLLTESISKNHNDDIRKFYHGLISTEKKVECDSGLGKSDRESDMNNVTSIGKEDKFVNVMLVDVPPDSHECNSKMLNGIDNISCKKKWSENIESFNEQIGTKQRNWRVDIFNFCNAMMGGKGFKQNSDVQKAKNKMEWCEQNSKEKVKNEQKAKLSILEEYYIKNNKNFYSSFDTSKEENSFLNKQNKFERKHARRKRELQKSHLTIPINSSTDNINCLKSIPTVCTSSKENIYNGDSGNSCDNGDRRHCSMSSENKAYYDRMMTHVFGIATLFYSNKSYLDKLSKNLPKEYLTCYENFVKNLNNIYENNLTHEYGEFYDLENKEKPIQEKGIEKYYYAFNRTVYTFLFFLYEILQKEDALHLSFEMLPMEYKLRNDELIDTIMKSTPTSMDDIYFTSYKFFDSMCTCFDICSCFNINYISKKLINNLNDKHKSNNTVSSELKKINEYMSNTRNDIKEFIKDLNAYFKQFFDYASQENLFNETVLYCYSLFFDYYRGMIDKLIDNFNIHLKFPINKKAQSDMIPIYNEIKMHANNLGYNMRSFYLKNNIKPDHDMLINSLFSDNAFRLRLIDKYAKSRYANFIFLLLNMMGYLRILIVSVNSFLYLQNVHALLLDVQNGNINFDDAVKALKYLTKFLLRNSFIFNPNDEKSE
ncbi:hypothetical protein, conserved [Plasmodium gonderi]|uniref:Erythrocyte vesicle protein 1 n=1 Tax=Plasmodium gonderi TaxID=77519 RepID=A0A1Y1J9V9_PLAGO|nr:hypothetical protein, conserved [Plasmodium gonderi]GAW79279.1 hypothetical protein, conserved [Plasmodium gonderi]